MLRPLNGPRTIEEVERIIRGTPPLTMLPLHMSDGPIPVELLQELIIGRVVGLYEHPGYGEKDS